MDPLSSQMVFLKGNRMSQLRMWQVMLVITLTTLTTAPSYAGICKPASKVSPAVPRAALLQFFGWNIFL